MRQTFLLTFIVLLVSMIGCQRSSQLQQDIANSITITTQTTKYDWCISYGFFFDSGELAYVVFVGKRKPSTEPLSCLVQTEGDNKAAKAWLEMPGKPIIRLPAKDQIFEYIDGHFQVSNERVSRREFEAFLKSKPDAYSISELLKFAKNRGIHGE